MSARIRSVALFGLTAQAITVQADFHATKTRSGSPATTPATALTLERRDRLRAALANSGHSWPAGQISVTGDMESDTALDLPLAIAVLHAAGAVSTTRSATTAVLGELALNGDLRPVPGTLARTVTARNAGCTHIIVPHGNAAEARHVDGITTIAVTCLNDALAWLAGTTHAAGSTAAPEPTSPPFDGDHWEARCDPAGIRAMVTAAAGGHHVLCVDHGHNSPLLLAQLLAALLPDLTTPQADLATTIRSLTDFPLPDSGLVTRPPLSRPHHSVSPTAFLGGGALQLRPGSVSLAHHGVLHLHEATEFSTPLLDEVATILDHGRFMVLAGGRAHQLPARFQLLLTAPGCPCGAQTPQDCSCLRAHRMRHGRRIPKALLDRIELRVPLVNPAAGQLYPSASSLELLRVQVSDARARAATRWADVRAATNAQAPASVLRPRVTRAGLRLLDRAVRGGRVSAQGAEQCLRVAWTYADLDARDHPTAADVDAAISLRQHAFLRPER